MANYWFAADYGNAMFQMPESGVTVKRSFTAVVNSAGGSLGGQNKVATLGSAAPDVICFCTLPGSGYGICITDFYVDFGNLDTGGASAALVGSLGLLLTSTTNNSQATSLDAGSTSIANAGLFMTGVSLAGNAVTSYRLSPTGVIAAAATPAARACVLTPGNPPMMLTNLSGTNPTGNVVTPNSGLYDLCFTVTTSANTVSAVDAYIRGWVEYFTLGASFQM